MAAMAVPAQALTIYNGTKEPVAGSIRFKGKKYPLYQFYIKPKSRIRWTKRIPSGDLELHAIVDKKDGKSTEATVAPLDTVNCYVEFKPGGKTLRVVVDD